MVLLQQINHNSAVEGTQLDVFNIGWDDTD